MSSIKNRVEGQNSNTRARNIQQFIDNTGNIYETLVIIGGRANQLNMELKQELTEKLEEFAVAPETIEEVHENKEQIEISKFYERLPNPAIIATEEFLKNKLDYRFGSSKKGKG